MDMVLYRSRLSGETPGISHRTFQAETWFWFDYRPRHDSSVARWNNVRAIALVGYEVLALALNTGSALAVGMKRKWVFGRARIVPG